MERLEIHLKYRSNQCPKKGLKVSFQINAMDYKFFNTLRFGEYATILLESCCFFEGKVLETCDLSLLHKFHVHDLALRINFADLFIGTLLPAETSKDLRLRFTPVSVPLFKHCSSKNLTLLAVILVDVFFPLALAVVIRLLGVETILLLCKLFEYWPIEVVLGAFLGRNTLGEIESPFIKLFVGLADGDLETSVAFPKLGVFVFRTLCWLGAKRGILREGKGGGF